MEVVTDSDLREIDLYSFQVSLFCFKNLCHELLQDHFMIWYSSWLIFVGFCFFRDF